MSVLFQRCIQLKAVEKPNVHRFHFRKRKHFCYEYYSVDDKYILKKAENWKANRDSEKRRTIGLGLKLNGDSGSFGEIDRK